MVTIWVLLLIVFAAGFVGGILNALLTDHGFVLPTKTAGVFRPGWIGNAVMGGVGAVVSWSLYGPMAGVSVVTSAGGQAVKGELSLAAIGGALLVGIAGARFLTNEVDKKLLRAAGAEASKDKGPGVVAAFASGSPVQALQAAQDTGPGDVGPELKRQ